MAIKDWKRIHSESKRSEYRSGDYLVIVDGKRVLVGDARFPEAVDQPEIMEDFDTVEEAEQFAEEYMREN